MNKIQPFRFLHVLKINLSKGSMESKYQWNQNINGIKTQHLLNFNEFLNTREHLIMTGS